jgi:hypothetical protein
VLERRALSLELGGKLAHRRLPLVGDRSGGFAAALPSRGRLVLPVVL